MASTIHPSAILQPGARIGNSVSIGPHAVIDADVILGDGCIVGPGVFITGHTVIGARNRFHAGAVIGDAPQDAKYTGSPTHLTIGDDNVFREHVTIHRSSKPDEPTRIGNGNLFMVGSHVGHNCHVGHHNVIANGALLAGHASVADRAFISGNCLVHQFCRVGRLAMMQGGSAISKDLPPFCIARGDNGICGLNVVGMRRAGIPAADRLALKRAYLLLFRGRTLARAAIEQARRLFPAGPAAELVEFVATTRRGICRDTGLGASASQDDGES